MLYLERGFSMDSFGAEDMASLEQMEAEVDLGSG
jgi:hypothetical protein